MVKLRGLNVFAEAIGAALLEDERSNGEFFCFVDHLGEARTDHMNVWVEAVGPGVDKQALKSDFERRLKEVLGVRVEVTAVDKGQLDHYTGTSSTSKVKRLMDRRSK